MPARESAWVERIRTAATAAGHEYKLWGEAELEAAFGGEVMWGWFLRARACLDDVTTWTLMSDYYGYRILAAEPGCLLDTDFELRGEWPDLPTDKVYGISESYDKTQLAYGIFVNKEPQPFAIATRLAEKHLLRAVDDEGVYFGLQYIELVRGDRGRESGLACAGIGPGWLRRVVLPAWAAAGVQWAFFDPHVVGHKKWAERPTLAHVGTGGMPGGWLHGRRGAQAAAFWGALAERARRAVKEKQQEERRAQWLQTTPARLRPQGAARVPALRVRREGQSGARASALRLPAGVRRVVVLSNVTRGFSVERVGLQASDLVIHLGHARHREAAMRVAPGARHWLVVRHGRGNDPLGWHWYGPESYDGFCRVFFFEDALWLHPYRWYAAYCAGAPGKSPTTGFAVANAVAESHPGLPLLLAGFDPGVGHGTPMWSGHGWEWERRWYAEHRFELLRPGKCATGRTAMPVEPTCA